MTTIDYSQRPVLGRFTQQLATAKEAGKGYAAALGESVKLGGEDIKNGWKVWDKSIDGKVRGVAFGRVAGVGAGLAITADAAFRGVDSEGNERGALWRLTQGVLGLATAAGSLIVGKGR